MAEEKPSALMSEAMEAYGIKPTHVLSSKDYGNHVVIVTRGGRKVTFARGDKVTKLAQVDLDGEIPEHVRRAREEAKRR